MSKVYEDGHKLREKTISAVTKVRNIVGSTMGPKGRTVLLQQKGKSPILTKDGVTCSRFIDLEDPVENAIVQIIKQAAEETNTHAGDGTTTSTVLTCQLVEKAQKYVMSSSSAVDIKRGMDKAAQEIIKNLKNAAHPVTTLKDLERIATISANNDKIIGELIASAIDLVGKDGAISIKEGRQYATTLETVEGFRFRGGLAAGAFVTDERTQVLKYNDPLFLVTDQKLDQLNPLMPVLEIAAKQKQPLIIVAEEIEGEALAALVANAMRGTLRVAAIKGPGYGEERRKILQDLAICVGATFISPEMGRTVDTVTLVDLGQSSTIESNKVATTIVGGKADPELLEKRIESLKAEMSITEDLYDCEKIQDRITRISSGVAIIHVGGSTEVEMLETKHRIEDALEAVKSAHEEGFVAGGGVALIEASKNIQVSYENEDQRIGGMLVIEACCAPLKKMCNNSGFSADIAISIVSGNTGINLATGEQVDMIDAGIIDPVKVTRIALQNAVSAAGTLLMTDYCVIES